MDLFGFVERTYGQKYRIIKDTVNERLVGNPKAPVLFNWPIMVPYFMIMLPETFQRVTKERTTLKDILHHMRVFNAKVGPNGECVPDNEYKTYDDLGKFFETSVRSLRGEIVTNDSAISSDVKKETTISQAYSRSSLNGKSQFRG